MKWSLQKRLAVSAVAVAAVYAAAYGLHLWVGLPAPDLESLIFGAFIGWLVGTR